MLCSFFWGEEIGFPDGEEADIWGSSVQKETVRWREGAYIARHSATPHPGRTQEEFKYDEISDEKQEVVCKSSTRDSGGRVPAAGRCTASGGRR